jgi:hypothetical protein
MKFRITAVQPLAPAAEDDRLEPSPFLPPPEAVIEAQLWARKGNRYMMTLLKEIPSAVFSKTTLALLDAGQLSSYTHLARFQGNGQGLPPAVCTAYLVRVEEL